MKAAHLDDQVALLLGGRAELSPVADGSAARLRAVEDGPGRKGRGVHDPGLRDEAAEHLEGSSGKCLRPIVLKAVMVEEPKAELLLLERPDRRRDHDFPREPGVHDVRRRLDVGQVKELEEPVEDVDLLGVALHVEEQLVLERENLVGREAEDPLALQLELLGEPRHLRPVGRCLVADHERDQGIVDRGLEACERGVEALDHLVATPDHAPGGSVEPVQEGGEADASRH